MNWPAVEFTLKTNRGQHPSPEQLLMVGAVSSLARLAVNLEVQTGSSEQQESVYAIVYTTSAEMLDPTGRG